MSRLFFMTFEGQRRWSEGRQVSAAPARAPRLVTWPMIILAVRSVGLGRFLALGGRFVTWLEPVTQGTSSTRSQCSPRGSSR